jgi:hypothetical protein
VIHSWYSNTEQLPITGHGNTSRAFAVKENDAYPQQGIAGG